MTKKEIDSLIKLLDDPDTDVFKAIRIKLGQMGSEVIPFLEKAWENSLDHLFQSRIENIIQEIHQNDITTQLKTWVDNGASDLFKGAFLINRFQYPDINEEELLAKIEKIKNDIWLEINENLTALEKVKIINHIFYELHNFSRNNTFQKNPNTHFLNQLLDSKKGSPISLSILYAIIAQQLNIPVYGVSLPKNFILCYRDKELEAFDDEQSNGVLFYINPFNKGIVFGKKEIQLFIKQQKLENKKAYFQPCTNRETIINLINSIIDYYESIADQTKADSYRSLAKILYF
ncbi:MAG: transglutaminase family protein [Salinivirgaceae bacterium]|nr:transglutaminase family protein [Salinivirgaceae bacterium]